MFITVTAEAYFSDFVFLSDLGTRRNPIDAYWFTADKLLLAVWMGHVYMEDLTLERYLF